MSSTTTTNTYIKLDYIQPSSSQTYDSSQSPLALLAQTCSSIGKDSSSPIVNSTPSIITSLVTKSSSNISNFDKSLSSTKRLVPSQINQTNKKSTLPLKSPTISSTNQSNYFSSLTDPTSSVASLLLRSSLAYLASQQHSYSTSCTMPGCLQCETTRYILSNSIDNQPYICHWYSCNARFSSNHDLIEHIRYNHSLSKKSDHYRFHPYLRSLKMTNNNDQLPYFYPHLSLSPMTETTKRTNINPNNNN
ncbi:unnamed protein product [Adineta steineri]|uniref:C2H2-type domain-containing protein n=1 Tax=Adineta steineri TaxID=433720 RepID=A0A816EGH2_9BILA|nr:unnamed protein product [Adineta steineri]CAF1648831.1 unnamed protein product [Adineta steineri]